MGTVSGSPAFCRPPGDRPPATRSRVTNGSELLPGVSGNAPLYRRYKDILAALVSDLGGAGQLSEACLQLCRRLAGHSCLAEAMEAKVVNGETIDLQEYALMTSNSVRVASRIGIERIARDISPPTLDQIAEEIEAEREANE